MTGSRDGTISPIYYLVALNNRKKTPIPIFHL